MGYHKNTFKLQDYRSSKIREAFRCSLENFGEFEYEDPEDNNAIRHVCLGLGGQVCITRLATPKYLPRP